MKLKDEGETMKKDYKNVSKGKKRNES